MSLPRPRHQSRPIASLAIAALFLALAASDNAAAQTRGKVPPHKTPQTHARPATNRAPKRAPDQPAPTPQAILWSSAGDLLEAFSLEFRGDRIAITDRAQTEREISLQNVAALVSHRAWDAIGPPIDPPDENFAPREVIPGVITLIDGQRFTGWLRLANGDEIESVFWRSPEFGQLAVPLDRVESIDLVIHQPANPPAPLASPADPAQDAIIFANGDRAAGTLVGVGAFVSMETSGALLQIPARRVKRITLAHHNTLPPETQPRDEADSSGPYLWLASGARVRFSALHSRALAPKEGARPVLHIEVTLPTGATVSLTPRDIIAVTTRADTLRPLADLAPTSIKPIGQQWRPERLSPRAPQRRTALSAMGARDLFIPSPELAQYQAPPRAVALITQAALPKRRWEWAQSTLTIWSARQPVTRALLNKKNPEPIIFAALTDRELLITLQPAGAGLTQAVCRLKQPLLVVLSEPQ